MIEDSEVGRPGGAECRHGGLALRRRQPFRCGEAALLAAGPGARIFAPCMRWRKRSGRSRLAAAQGRNFSLGRQYSADQDKSRGGEADIRLDDAARAGWLYYVAGNTQDEIAQKLGVSRQTAQRLVAMSVSEKLIKVRLDHPIAHCMELAARLKERFGLELCEVVPSDPASTSRNLGIAEAAAADMEQRLKSLHPIVLAIGSGRSLRAAVEQLEPMAARTTRSCRWSAISGRTAPPPSTT